MFELNIDDYLEDEMDELKCPFEFICKDWEQSISVTRPSMVRLSLQPNVQSC